MNKEKIKKYDELDDDEKEVLDSFRKMKLLYDHSRFKLHRLEVENLIRDYEELMNLHEDIQSKYFDLLAELAENDFIEGGFDMHKWSIHREQEDLVWNAEMMLLDEIKNTFNQGLELIKVEKRKNF